MHAPGLPLANDSFEGRHDLSELFRASGLLQLHEERGRKRKSEEDIARSALGSVMPSGNRGPLAQQPPLRLRGQPASPLPPDRTPPGVPGGCAQKNSADSLLAAEFIVEEGSRSWTLKEKVEKALQSHFQVEHLDLRDDNGIIGVMVSPDFEGVGRLTARDGLTVSSAIGR